MRQIPTGEYCGKCPCRAWGPNLEIISDGTITGKHCQKWDDAIGEFHKMFGWKRLPQCLRDKPQVLTLADRVELIAKLCGVNQYTPKEDLDDISR